MPAARAYARPSGDRHAGPGRGGRAPSTVPPAMKTALIILTVAAALRLLLAALVPLVPDEAYYWEWSRHLATGYFDHPPAIAWLVRAGTAVAGETSLGVRLGVIVAGYAGCLAAVVLAHRLAGASAATRTAVIISVVPMAGIGLVLATPDVPLLAGAAGVLWALDHAVDGVAASPTSAGRLGTLSRTAGGWWLLVGVMLGATLLSKYPAVLLPAGVALGLAMSPPLRGHFARPGPYLACAIAALIFLPVVQWNAGHGWVSFAFQLRHGLGPPRGSVASRQLQLLGAQLGLVTPILFVLLVLAVAEALRQPDESRPFLLATIGTFVWGFFAASAIRHPVSPNWPALALLPAIVVLGVHRPGRAWLKWERAGVLLAAAVVLALSVHAVHPWLPLSARQDPFAQAYGWDDLARAVAADDDRVVPQGNRVWLAADRYQEAAELAWHLPQHPRVFSLELASRHNEYDFWPTAADSVRLGDSMTLVLDESTEVPAPVRRLTPLFAHVVRGPLVSMHWGPDRVVSQRRIWHFLTSTVSLTTLLARPQS
jgi:4-amino-4-deoxy-L-arabinose transferase-like glycosyltransferase